MSFNIGWICKECGPVADSKKRSINKVQWDCCKECGGIVTKWERPLNKRSGRCGNCGDAGFTSKIVTHHIHRTCKTCNEIYDIEADKVLTKGDRKHEYKPKTK